MDLLSYIGTNYSDTGAIRARQMATQLKNSGVTIFSIGVGLHTFKGSTSNGNLEYDDTTGLDGSKYLLNQLSRHAIAATSFSTVENKLSYTWNTSVGGTNTVANRKLRWDNNKNAIAALNWEIGNYNGARHSLNEENNFENWLKYSIGSGQYFDVDNSSAMATAMESIFSSLSAIRNTTVWSTTDNMSAYDSVNTTQLLNFIEFIGFYDENNQLRTSLSGTSGVNNTNTASISGITPTNGGVVNWDLKKSGYSVSDDGAGTTIYEYTLKYKVRLKTEKNGFVSGKAYETNGATNLTYAIQDNGTLSNTRSINYLIPQVKGTLMDLKVSKVVQGLASGKTFTAGNSEYQFTVNFKDSGGNPMTNTLNYDKYNSNDTAIASNVTITTGGTFTLKNGEYAIVHNIPSGTTYEVIETSKDGFTTNVSSGSATGTITTAVNQTDVEFTNRAYSVQLLKVDENDNSIALNDAVFTLYSTYNNGTYSNVVTNMNGDRLENLSTTGNGVLELGNISYTAGGSSTYYLKEMQAPDRYNTLTDPIIINVSSSGVTAQYQSENMLVDIMGGDNTIYNIVIGNEQGIAFPETGGIGTDMYIILGIAIITLSSYILIKINIKK